MIIKEFLEREDVNLNRFAAYRKNCDPVIRRSLKRMYGGETTIPVPCPNTELREKIHTKLEAGEYKLGSIICPIEYKKFVINDSGEIEEQIFVVSGRQITLRDIREDALREHERMGIIRNHSDEKYDNMTPNEIIKRLEDLGEYDVNEDLTVLELTEKLRRYERTRHMIMWSDHSSIMNHGHLLLTVNFLYDTAFFLSREELKSAKGIDIDIEKVVQRPQVYILGRCSDKLVDQLCYIANRVEDLQELEDQIESECNALVTDVMRFFHGDHPAQAVEAGQQEGGHYPCCLCDRKVISWTDGVACYRAKTISLQDRVDKVSFNQQC